MADTDPVDALYVEPPDGFVAARDTLAKQLREAGDRTGAARVRALRRPTRAAWAVNVAVRERPDAAEELADAAGRLRDAHRELLAGGAPSQLHDAEGRVDAARETLAATAPVTDPPTLEKVRATLRAAAVDADVLAEVTSGRLVREQVASGFGDLGGFAPAVPAPTRRAAGTDTATASARAAEKKAADAQRAARANEKRAAREAEERAAAANRKRIRQAREQEAAAEAAAAAARLALDEAEGVVATRRAELDAADARLADTKQARRRAEQA